MDYTGRAKTGDGSLHQREQNKPYQRPEMLGFPSSRHFVFLNKHAFKERLFVYIFKYERQFGI